MPGPEKMQYPFPYKNESGLAGNEGDVETNDLLVHGDAVIEGDLDVLGTITGNFVGTFEGPYFTATDDGAQWRTTTTTGVTEFFAENQVNPMFQFINQDGVIAPTTISVGKTILVNEGGDTMTTLIDDTGRGVIRTADEAFGIEIATGAGKQIKLTTGTIDMEADTLTANVTETKFDGKSFNATTELEISLAAGGDLSLTGGGNASYEGVLNASINSKNNVSISAGPPLIPQTVVGTIGISSKAATTITADVLKLELTRGIQSTAGLTIASGPDLTLTSGGNILVTATPETDITLNSREVSSEGIVVVNNLTDSSSATDILSSFNTAGGGNFAKKLYVGGYANFGDNVDIQGDTHLFGTFLVDGVTTLTGDVTVTGDLTAADLYSNGIVQTKVLYPPTGNDLYIQGQNVNIDAGSAGGGLGGGFRVTQNVLRTDNFSIVNDKIDMAVAGEITIHSDGPLGQVKIEANDVGGSVVLNATIGAIEINAFVGAVSITNEAGEINVTGGIGGVNINSGIGEIEIGTGVGATTIGTGLGLLTLGAGLGEISIGGGGLLSIFSGETNIICGATTLEVGGFNLVAGITGIEVGALNLASAATSFEMGIFNLITAAVTAATGVVEWTTIEFRIIGDLIADSITTPAFSATRITVTGGGNSF